MRRYLLVLDRDLVTADEPRPEPVDYLAARQEEEPCQVTVLALVRSSKAQVPIYLGFVIPAPSADSAGRTCRSTMSGRPSIG